MRKHTWKFYVAVAACILAAMHLINRIIAILSREQDFLFSYHGSFYPWRSGNVFYTRQGEGTPVLLIHNLDPAGSDLEYRSVLSALAQEHTVYTVDLPGCGRSDKPAISYTAYSYVQMIRDFIKEVVEEPVTLAASGNSAPFAILTAHSDPELVSDLVLINPAGLRTKCRVPAFLLIACKKLLELPVIGTFLYYVFHSRCALRRRLSKEYHNPSRLKARTLGAAYEAAHQGGASGKYLFASMCAHYTDCPVSHALASVKLPITLLIGAEEPDGAETANDYVHINPDVRIRLIARAKRVPHLEQPAATILQLQD